MSRRDEDGVASEPEGLARGGERRLTLGQVAGVLDVQVSRHDAGLRLAGIAYDSQEVRRGDLFFAVPGTRVDGHDFLEEAARGGAAAAVVERDAGEVEIPLLRVPDARQALARAAGAWYGEPGSALTLVGITGTLGKTSVLSMFEAIALEQGVPVGSIGSLGVRLEGREHPTGHTAPDPLTLHAALAAIADTGARLAAMEVTSHAIDQERVHGLRFDLGIFTNLVPLEHTDYHGSFRAYTQVKRRFLDLLAPEAPLVYTGGDRAIGTLVRAHEVRHAIAVGRSPRAAVRIIPREITPQGSRISLSVCRPLPRLGGGEVGTQEFEVSLQLLGRGNVLNASLAATAALIAGASPAAVQRGLARIPAPRRRMELFEVGGVRVIDDTVGHPDSISAVFEVAEALRPRRLHVAFAVRGSRGTAINRRSAEALAIWCDRDPPATLVITSSEGSVEERDRVSERERQAFRGALERAGVAFEEERRLEPAVARVMEAARPGDLVLLLGAQGMDGAGDLARGEG
jgi:UDP-N-acetylmuramoyl-L-alanyl-D-glutamate--2,6-diaminopimelate ligase